MRESSVDTLLCSVGWEPLTLFELWGIANAAYEVIMAAVEHLDKDSFLHPDDEAFPILMQAHDDLLAVMRYTCELRSFMSEASK